MQTQSDIFSSPKSQETETTRGLTERLYSDRPQDTVNDPFSNKAQHTFEELRKLLGAQSPSIKTEVDSPLEKVIKNFQASQADKIAQYLQRKSVLQNDNCLYYLNGWSTADLFLTEESRKSTGGIFLRWNGKGIAINPGARFLQHFHAQGLHIRDIDYVIVTGDQPECYTDVKEIYELNYQINKSQDELQIIHYYFNQKAFQDLSRILKPHFKQERNTLHSLELFVDSSDVEKVDLVEGITLYYFSATSRDAFPTSSESKEVQQNTSLGIRLELDFQEVTRSIGYISKTAWNPLLAHHLGRCDLLIAGFGNTESQDYQKLAYLSDCLGYYGIATLVEEVGPRLVLCGEFEGRDGDIRLEVVQKMRSEYGGKPILPADAGLCVNLKTLEVRCSVSAIWAESSQIKVVKAAQAFGPLAYISSRYVY